jgi:hypothetical protein
MKYYIVFCALYKHLINGDNMDWYVWQNAHHNPEVFNSKEDALMYINMFDYLKQHYASGKMKIVDENVVVAYML